MPAAPADPFRFNGAAKMDTVLITGAGRGLGLEFARQYAAAGWRVLACVRRPSPALAGLAGIHGNVSAVALDVDDHEQVDHLARKLATAAIDVLINNAGIMGKHGFDDGGVGEQRLGVTDYEEFGHVLRTNVLGSMKMTEAFIEHVARGRQRKIVTLTSIVGSMALNTSGGLYAYRASKAAVNAIMKSMAIDLRARGIIAVAMHPGWVRTAMGGQNADIDVSQSVSGMRHVIAQLTLDAAEGVLTFDGRHLPY